MCEEVACRNDSVEAFVCDGVGVGGVFRAFDMLGGYDSEAGLYRVLRG